MPSEEYKQVIENIRAQERPENLTIDEQRADFEARTTLLPLASDIVCQPVQANGIPAEWVTAPEAENDRVILYLHGGGFVIGSINTHREMVSHISRAARARILLIDYRLAPEHPFPAGLEDSRIAYRWLISEGFDPGRMIIAGDSAGGGLTISTLLALRDNGDPLPAAAVCLSPWVDLEGLGESMTTNADSDPQVDQKGLLEMAEQYLAGADPRTPLAAPLYADLKGLPPLLIQAGAAETLLDDSTRLAAKAREQGVDVILEPWEDMLHVWQFLAAFVPEARQAVAVIGEFVIKHTS